MALIKILLSLGLTAAAANAASTKVDIWARLSKPAVRKDFTGFEELLTTNLPERQYNISVW